MIDDIIEEKQSELLDLMPPADKYDLSYLFAFDFSDKFVNNFIQWETKRLIYNEFVKFELLSEGFLHYNLTHQSFNKFSDFFVANCQISDDSVRTLIEEAVQLKFNFMLKPLETLETVIFKGDTNKSAFEVFLGLKLFSVFHQHILDYVLDEYDELTSEDMYQIVTASQFVKIIRALDRQFHEDKTIEEFVGYLAPVYEIFGEGFPPKVLVIIIKEILLDKQLYSAAELIEKEFTDSDLITPEQTIRQLSLIDSSNNLDYKNGDDLDKIQITHQITKISADEPSEADEDFYLKHIENIDSAEDDYIVGSGSNQENSKID